MRTTDTFALAWDLAAATGQSTDLDPELATHLLTGSNHCMNECLGRPGLFGSPNLAGRSGRPPISSSPSSDGQSGDE